MPAGDGIAWPVVSQLSDSDANVDSEGCQRESSAKPVGILTGSEIWPQESRSHSALSFTVNEKTQATQKLTLLL
jgi:hypothetical protein